MRLECMTIRGQVLEVLFHDRLLSPVDIATHTDFSLGDVYAEIRYLERSRVLRRQNPNLYSIAETHEGESAVEAFLH